MSKRGVRLGLAAAVWFGALSRAAFDLWAATALFAWLTLLAALFLWGRSREGAPVKAPLALPLLLWAGAAALSLTGSFDVNTTVLEVLIWLFSLLFFFLLVNSAEDDAEREEFFVAAGASIVPVGAIAAWQWFTAVADRGEIHATLINSSVLAGFALCWPFIFGRSALKRRALLLPFAAALAALLVARSWWAYVSLAAGALYFHRRRARAWARRNPSPAAALGAGGAALLALIVYLKLRVHSGPFVGVSRLYYWRAALLMFVHSPLTGIGLGGFKTAYPFFRGEHGDVQNTLFAHDFPLQLLAETGLAGLGAVAGVVWGFARLIRTAGVKNSPERDARGAALVALLCFGLTSIFFEYFLGKLLLLALLGTLAADGASFKFRLRPLWAGAAGAGLLLCSVFWLRPLEASRLLEAGLEAEGSGDLSGAEKLCRDAVELDPTLGDADWVLYRLEKNRYAASRSPEDLRRAGLDLRRAMRLKKSALYWGEAAWLSREETARGAAL